MLAKSIALATIIAACGVMSGAVLSPSKQPGAPPEKPAVKVQHFCGQSVDPENYTGDGCVTIGPNQIDAWANVLYCEGNRVKQDGKVFCE